MASERNIGVIRGVAVGSFGQNILVTLRDLDGVAQDVSSFTGTRTAIAQRPGGRSPLVTATVSFNSDGIDGVVSFNWATGDIDESGEWEIQITLNKGAARVKSFIGRMPVIPALQEDT